MHTNMPGPAPDLLLPSPSWRLNGEHHQRAHTLFKVVLPYSCTQNLTIMIITVVPKQWSEVQDSLQGTAQGTLSGCLGLRKVFVALRQD